MTLRYKLTTLSVLLTTLFMSACGLFKKTPAVQPTHPQLVVFISIDQMRYDYLERFGDLFTGGFRRLLDEGAVFTNAQHLHANTATAPGHATLGTGCHPSKHGIVGNNIYLRDSKTMEYCVEDKNTRLMGIETDEPLIGASPFRLMRPGLGDWFKSADPASKVYGIALKDRSAILMAGQHPDGVFWFNKTTTRFVSSDYYYKEFPAWIRQLSGEQIYEQELALGWHKKLDDAAYNRSRPDNFEWETRLFPPRFPHTRKSMLPPDGNFGPTKKNGSMLFNTPFGDGLVLEMGKHLIGKEKLGRDEHPDILFLGCSAADYIGHHFGPMSHEVQDYYLWMDEYLGNFLKYLDEQFGHENYLLLLSSDHGVLPLPEELQRQGKEGRRVLSQEFDEALDSVEAEVKRQYGIKGKIINKSDYSGISLRYNEPRVRGIEDEQLREAFAEKLKELDFVVETYTLEELQSDVNKTFIDRFRRSEYPQRGHEIRLLNIPNALVDAWQNGTNHGTAYGYDNHVPVLFFGKGIQAARISRQIGTIDIAPTIASILEVPVAHWVDGKAIRELRMVDKTIQ